MDAVRLFEPVERGDARMIERAEELRFAREPRQAVRIASEARRQHLQGDVALQFRVAGPVDLAHGAGAEHGDNLVGADAITGTESGERLVPFGAIRPAATSATAESVTTANRSKKLTSGVSDCSSDSTSRRSTASSPVSAARNASRSSGARSMVA